MTGAELRGLLAIVADDDEVLAFNQSSQGVEWLEILPVPLHHLAAHTYVLYVR